MDKEVLLTVKDMCKSFGPTKAVEHVSLDVSTGEIRGLIGENGSGKSTLTTMISGYQKRDTGTMSFCGQPYDPQTPIEAVNIGVSMIVQEMGTIEGLTVAENIFLGNESEFYKGGINDKKKMNQKAKELLDGFGMNDIDPAADIGRYSFEERKLIELVKTTYKTPKLLIVDETTTALSQKGRNKLYDLMKSIRASGGSVIFISHDLEEVLEMCDTITVFKDGQVVKYFDNDGTLHQDDLKTSMVGREFKGNYYRTDYGRKISAEVVLKVEGISGLGLKNINFELHKGEILGMGGLSESGMHELAKLIFAIEKPDSGSVTVCNKGVDKKITSIQDAIRNSIGYASKNRDTESLLLQSSIKTNIALVNYEAIKNKVLISHGKEKKYAQDAAEKMKVKMSSVDQDVSDLSGGNKQKVALAKWISKGSDILVLDCPTRGIDVMVKASIYSLMYELVNEGKSIIMITEELAELIGMCDRMLILKDGCISGEIERNIDLAEETVIKYMV